MFLFKKFIRIYIPYTNSMIYNNFSGNVMIILYKFLTKYINFSYKGPILFQMNDKKFEKELDNWINYTKF